MGFFSQSKEVVDFSVVNLLDPGLADDEARRWATTFADGDIDAYIDTYTLGWRKSYRRSFSEKRLKKDGFLPTTTQVKKIKRGNLIAFLKANGHPDAVTFVSIRDYIGGVVKQVIITYADAAGKNHDAQFNKSQLPKSMTNFKTVTVMPIVRLKKDNVLVNKDEHKLKRIMKKLNVSDDSIWTQLKYTCDGYTAPVDDPSTPLREDRIPDDPKTPDDESDPAWCPQKFRKKSEIDNAYIFTGVYPGNKDQGSLMALYDSFTRMSGSTGEFGLTLDEIGLEYSWFAKLGAGNGQLKDDKGRLLKVGECNSSQGMYTPPVGGADSNGNNWVVPGGPGSNAAMTYRKQVSKNRWESIQITKFSQTWSVKRNGKIKKKVYPLLNPKAKKGEEETRIAIPLDTWNDMKFKYWVELYEHSLSMVVFVHKKIKLKWYQTGMFKVIFMIAMAVISILVPGSQVTLAAVMEKLGTALLMGISSQVLGSINPELGLILNIVMTIWAAGGSLTFDVNTMFNFDNFLPFVTKAVDTYNLVEEIQIKSAIEYEKEELEKIEKENDDLLEIMKETAGPRLTLVTGDFSQFTAHESPGGMISPEDYFAQKYGNSIYNFDALFDVDWAVERRKEVKLA